TLSGGPSVDDDPVAAWRTMSDGVQALLEDPASARTVLRHQYIGEVPLPQAVSQFFTADVFMHTWDLARATGQDDTLDPERCAVMLAGMEPMEGPMRASGQYGPRVEVPTDADVQTKMLGFIGRDPGWRAPSSGGGRDDHARPRSSHPVRNQLTGVGAPRRPGRPGRPAQAQG